MDSKKIRKSIGRFIGWIGLISSSLIIKVLPQRCIYGFARNIARLAYLVARKQRKIAFESLTIAFGEEKLKAEIEQIAKDCFTFMAKAGFEILYFMDRPQLIRKNVELQGKEHLEAALARGKGVILVSAHFGNFPLLMAKLSLEGYPTSGIIRHMRDERAEKFFAAKRKQAGLKTIHTQPRKACVEQTIKTLRHNELVFIPMDQNFGSGGVFVDFFGKKAATATGPIVLALRTQAALLPCFIVRQKDNRNKVIFEPALELEKGGDYQEVLIRTTQQITRIIESYIRKYPSEWGWIHRRWKSRPG